MFTGPLNKKLRAMVVDGEIYKPKGANWPQTSSLKVLGPAILTITILPINGKQLKQINQQSLS